MNFFNSISSYIRKTVIINMIPIIPIKTKNKFVCFIWSLLYRKWLLDDYSNNRMKVITVKGWRTALVEQIHKNGMPGRRQLITPCFWGLD